MALIDKLPIEILINIYEYDITYRDVFKESLNFIDYVLPKCSCSESDSVGFRWCWNACPKHNPSAYDKNGYIVEPIVPDILPIISSPYYSIGSIYYECKKYIIDHNWIKMCAILYYYSEWLILRRLHNTFIKGRYKKQSWSRFMDMNHNQRIIVG
tara:strand:+ start:15 stop:479 length:465 start_codon:yes stop_codon:yes gene_type:complete